MTVRSRKWWQQLLLVIVLIPGAVLLVQLSAMLRQQGPKLEMLLFVALLGAGIVVGSAGWFIRSAASRVLVGGSAVAFGGSLFVALQASWYWLAVLAGAVYITTQGATELIVRAKRPPR